MEIGLFAIWALLIVPVAALATQWLPLSMSKMNRLIMQVSISLSALLFCMALGHPRVQKSETYSTIQPKNFIGLVDDSGSSMTCFDAANGTLAAAATADEQLCGPNRLQMFRVLREQFASFAAQRSQDHVAATLFSDDVNVVSSLSELPVKTADALVKAQRIAAGTDLEKALRSAIEQFRQNGGQNNVLVVLSDGEDSIKLDKLLDLSIALRDLKVHLYWVHPAQTPGLMQTGSQPMLALVNASGGKAFDALNAAEVSLAMNTIGTMEAPVVTKAVARMSVDLTLGFHLAGTAFLLIFCFALYGALEEGWKAEREGGGNDDDDEAGEGGDGYHPIITSDHFPRHRE